MALSGGVILTLDGDTVAGTSFSDVSPAAAIIQVDAGDLLTLAGIDTITGVSGSSIANAGQIEITGTTTLTIATLTNTSAGILKVDATSQLNLSGVTLSGGTVTDNGTIHVTGASKIDGNAALEQRHRDGRRRADARRCHGVGDHDQRQCRRRNSTAR